MMEMTEVRSAGIYLLDEIENDLVYVTHRGFSKVFSKGMKRVEIGGNHYGEGGPLRRTDLHRRLPESSRSPFFGD